MKPILLDTAAYTAFVRGDPEALRTIQNAAAIHISIVVLAELISGFVMGAKEQSNRAELSSFLSSKRVSIVPADQATAEQYAAIRLILRRAGKPSPTNDMWIAATALQHQLCLFTYDGHFKSVIGLSTVSTLAELALP